MEPEQQKAAADLERIQEHIAEQRRRLKKTAKKSQALTTDTDFLLKAVEKPKD
jgi:hypothetical protein